MQFQVPQFIETEDKIVGPLSLRQFAYLGAVAGVSFFLFFMIQTWLWFIITIILGGVGFSMAFVKVQGRSLVGVFISAIKFFWQPQTFVWQPKKTHLKKDKAALGQVGKPKLPLESLVGGLALRNTWRKLQTQRRAPRAGDKKFGEKMKERYQIFERISGERRAARRVDYR